MVEEGLRATELTWHVLHATRFLGDEGSFGDEQSARYQVKPGQQKQDKDMYPMIILCCLHSRPCKSKLSISVNMGKNTYVMLAAHSTQRQNPPAPRS